jgi:hypothetical protein
MAAVPEMMRCCAQPWRDVQDAMPPQASFTNFLTHINYGAGPEPSYQCRGRLCGESGHQALRKSIPRCKSRRGWNP